jgi:hypothetical protein
MVRLVCIAMPFYVIFLMIFYVDITDYSLHPIMLYYAIERYAMSSIQCPMSLSETNRENLTRI